MRLGNRCLMAIAAVCLCVALSGCFTTEPKTAVEFPAGAGSLTDTNGAAIQNNNS